MQTNRFELTTLWIKCIMCSCLCVLCMLYVCLCMYPFFVFSSIKLMVIGKSSKKTRRLKDFTSQSNGASPAGAHGYVYIRAVRSPCKGNQQAAALPSRSM